MKERNEDLWDLEGAWVRRSSGSRELEISSTRESQELRAQGVGDQEITIWADVIRYRHGACGRGGGPY